MINTCGRRQLLRLLGVAIFILVISQQRQNICITFVQCWTNVEDVGPTLYKCYTNILCLLGCLKNVGLDPAYPPPNYAIEIFTDMNEVVSR